MPPLSVVNKESLLCEASSVCSQRLVPCFKHAVFKWAGTALRMLSHITEYLIKTAGVKGSQ